MELSRQSIKRLIYLILLTSVAFVIAYHFQAYLQNDWIVWSALPFALIPPVPAFNQRLMLVVVTGIMLALVVFLAGIFASSIILLAFFLLLLTFFGLMLMQRYPVLLLNIFLVLAFAIVSGVPAHSLIDNVNKVLFILLGTSIVFFSQFILRFHYLRDEFYTSLDDALSSLSQLSACIFSCFIHIEYAEYVYLFERRLHVQKHRYLRAIAKLRTLAHHAEEKNNDLPTQKFQPVISKLEDVFAVILEFAQLRKRVSDQSTFQLCTEELIAIDEELKKTFAILIKKKKVNQALDTTILANKIKRLEENYTHVLQVAAKEPLVFLLFISSLNTLCEVLSALYSSLHALEKDKSI